MRGCRSREEAYRTNKKAHKKISCANPEDNVAVATKRPLCKRFVSRLSALALSGGLEALGLFLKNTPPESGIAIVIVQHLDPTHKGIMVELLQRATTMKVFQVKDRMKVEPNSCLRDSA